MKIVNIGTFAQHPFGTLVTHDFKAFEYEGNHYKTDMIQRVGPFREMAEIYNANPSKFLGTALAGEPFLKSINSKATSPKTRDYSPAIQCVVDTWVDFEKNKSKPKAGVKPAIPERYKITLDSDIHGYEDNPDSYYSDSIIECKSSDETYLVFVGTPGADPNVKDVELIQEKHEKLLDKISEKTDAFNFGALYYRADFSSLGAEVDINQARGKILYEMSKGTHFNADLLVELFQGSAMHHPGLEVVGKDGLTALRRIVNKILSDRRIFHRNEFEGYLKLFYNFQYNVVLGRTEILLDGIWQKINDYQLNSILREMENKGAKISVQKLTGLLQSDFVKPFHPFREYFSALPEWDGADHIAELAKQVQTTDQEYWVKCLRKGIVALVASAIIDHIVNHTVLIFVGDQGIGKSTYFLNLIPEKLREYIYSGVLNPADKDSMIHLSECVLINLDELETLTKYKESALKEIITKSDIRVRRPYARYAEKMHRHASLCGSVNDQSVLNDPSGSRRFLVHKVNSINYQHEVNMEQVFSQALNLFRTGFTYWFTNVEIQQVHSHNQQFEMQSVEEELLLSNYEPISSTHSAALRYTATEILKRVRQDSSGQSINHSAKIRMGQALAKHGFEHVRSSGITYGFVNPVTSSSYSSPGPDQDIS